MTEDSARGFVEHPSRLSFQATVDHLAEVITKAGMTVFARIDHAAGAREVGLSMLPATVLIYGQARGGTPIMQAAPAAALDLPLRVLVREDGEGKVLIAFHPIVALLRPYGVPEDAAAKLGKAQQILVDAVA
jgi:uncharacterized protein (DUF302 family)